MKHVEAATIVVAMLDVSSFGVGMEIKHAMSLGKPVIGFKSRETNVSRMVADAFKEKGYPILDFKSPSDATHEILIHTTHRIKKLPFYGFSAVG